MPHTGAAIVKGRWRGVELAQLGHKLGRPAANIQRLVTAIAQHAQQTIGGQRQGLLLKALQCTGNLLQPLRLRISHRRPPG